MIAAQLAAVVDPDAARRDAQRILSDRRYRPSAAPRPLHGVLRWLADRFGGIFRRIGDHLPALPWWQWAIAAAIMLGAIAWGIVRARRRRATLARPRAAPARGAREREEDPDALERAADEAERDGDPERAIRLRFRAGLLRLGARGAITYRPSVTTGEVRRLLGSQRFDELAGTFEEVAYGGRTAGPPDVRAARREWPRVLEESRRR